MWKVQAVENDYQPLNTLQNKQTKKIPKKQKLPQSHFLMAYPYIKWVSKIAEVQLLTLRAN